MDMEHKKYSSCCLCKARDGTHAAIVIVLLNNTHLVYRRVELKNWVVLTHHGCISFIPFCIIEQVFPQAFSNVLESSTTFFGIFNH